MRNNYSVLTVGRSVIIGALLLAAGAASMAADCALTLRPSSRVQGYGNNTNFIDVVAQNGCLWSVANTNSWITILSAPDNTGPGSVVYSVGWNTSPEPRSGHIVVGGRPFMIMQTGNPARLDVMTRTNDSLTLAVQGEATKMYVLQYSDDFVNWTPVSTNPAQSVVTNIATGNAPRGLYRTLKLP